MSKDNVARLHPKDYNQPLPDTVMTEVRGMFGGAIRDITEPLQETSPTIRLIALSTLKEYKGAIAANDAQYEDYRDRIIKDAA